eukprot:Gb_32718 [translate_table: standard]
MDITYYPANDLNRLELNEHIMEKIENCFVQVWRLPTLGKALDYTFHGMMSECAKSNEFIRNEFRYEPKRLILSKYIYGVLGFGNKIVVMDKMRCSLEGLCIY